MNAIASYRISATRLPDGMQINCETAGFTLVELLVTIGVIGILAALLLSALSGAKMKALTAPCLNNQKQLALAWTMYTDDNSGRLVGFNTWPLSPQNWRTDTRFVGVDVPEGTSPQEAHIFKVQMGYKQPSPDFTGPLFKYAPNVGVLHCPGDARFKLPLEGGFAWDSYSGVNGLNGEGKPYLVKRSELLHPSERFLWVEGADGRGENLGSWQMQKTGTPPDFKDAKFRDSPGDYHVNAGTFSYADGHAVLHKWLDSSTIAFAKSRNPRKERGSKEQKEAQKNSTRDQPWVGRQYPTVKNP